MLGQSSGRGLPEGGRLDQWGRGTVQIWIWCQATSHVKAGWAQQPLRAGWGHPGLMQDDSHCIDGPGAGRTFPGHARCITGWSQKPGAHVPVRHLLQTAVRLGASEGGTWGPPLLRTEVRWKPRGEQGLLPARTHSLIQRAFLGEPWPLDPVLEPNHRTGKEQMVRAILASGEPL